MSVERRYSSPKLKIQAGNFGVESLEQSGKLDRLAILISLAIAFSKHHFFPNRLPKSSAFTVFWFFFLFCFVVLLFFFVFFCFFAVLLLRLKRRPLFRSQIFSVTKCYDIQGSHLIGYLWVSFIIDRSECLVCYFLCTELTLFYIELPENCIYLNQLELSNFFKCISLALEAQWKMNFSPTEITSSWLWWDTRFLLS